MGRTYTVPRSAKGESRILYIFTIKSLAITLAFAAIGVIIYFILKSFMDISIVAMILIIAPFAGLGFLIGATNIPDSPIMEPLRKAGGENVFDILIRLIMFRYKKKIYIYGINRKIEEDDKKRKIGGGLYK